MQKNILLPQVELTMESVTVVGWLVKIGDHVQADQPILEIESQKGIVEVPSSGDGYVRTLCVQKGDTIGEKALLCILTDAADEEFRTNHGDTEARREENLRASVPSVVNQSVPGAILAAPAARKLAKDLGIDIAMVRGTGPSGRITVDDVQKSRGSRVDSESFREREARGREEEGEWQPLPAQRLALIAQMQKSLAEIPQFHIVRQMDVAPLLVKAEGITFTHRLVRACAAALAKHPSLTTLICNDRYKRMSPCVAVAMDTANGLVAPAVRNADKLSLAEIASALRELRTRAEAGRTRREDVVDAPFAISNLGMFGVDFFNAFVFHGQTAVLAVGRAVEGKASFSLALDHRVVDGAEGARFLETLQQEIQKGMME